MTQLAPNSLVARKDINVFWRSNGEYCPSRISEISYTSAFIKTSRPEPVGTLLYLRLDLPGREISAQAIVRRVVRERGMGVEFQSMSDGDRARLDLWVVIQADQEPQPDAGPAPAAAAPNTPSSSSPAHRSAAPRRTHRRVEQRTRVRHKISANVDLTETGTARSIKARLTDLGQGGCYLKLSEPLPLGASIEISVSGGDQSFAAQAKIVSSHPGEGMGLAFTEVAPQDRIILDAWLATSMERTWLASNRRKSHRIMVNIPVHVATKNPFGTEVFEDTKTVSISAHGALLQLEMDVTKGQTLLLRNAKTNDALECSVDYLGSAREGRREVGVSFVVPNQTLWQISFPPEDWSPQHPDAKRS